MSMDKDGTAPSARLLSNRTATEEDTLSEDRSQQPGKPATPTCHVGMTDDLVVDASLGEIFRDERGERQSNKLLHHQSSPLARLMERTGYSIVQQNGQRRYGPPPSWDGPPPPRGCEVFVGKIPRDCFEDELVPVFERTGDLYEMRLMMDYNGQNRGYAFVVYTAIADAKECVKLLNNYEIRKGRTLGVCISVDNCRLFVGGIPKRINKDEIREEMDKVTEGVVDVIVYPSASDKSKNRGFAFVEYESHRVAAMARRKLMNGRVQLWGHQIAVDWAEPELEVAEEIMAHVKVLYVRNLMLATTEQRIEQVFTQYAAVERVKKIRDYAFVHFLTREGALKAMKILNGTNLDGANIEVTLAKPVDKDTYSRSPRSNKPVQAQTIPTFGFLPVDYTSLVPAIYPGYIPASPKHIPRNSMGARVIRSPLANKTKKSPGGYYPVALTPQLVFPASPVQGPFMSQYFDSPKRSQTEESLYEVIPGVELSPAPPPQPAPAAIPLKVAKNTLQILEEICQKHNWGSPIYSLNATSQVSEGSVLQYKVTVPALGTTYIPSKFSRSIDEAKCVAAEYSLIQLGFPLEATGYSSNRGFPTSTPLTVESATAAAVASYQASYAALHTTTKPPAPPTWSPEAALFATGCGYEAHYPPPQAFQPPELQYQHHHRSF